MEHLSLYARLRALQELNELTVVRDPDFHLEGEGELQYKGEKISIMADYVGPSPDNSGMKFTEPHDIAWLPSKKVVLAYGKSEHPPFVPIKQRPVYANYQKKV